MKNRWNQSFADTIAEDELALRVYSSNLLGAEEDLVLHGGGNTSLKGTVESIFGKKESVIFIKGSGWDLRSIEKAGFPAARLNHLLKLSELDSLSDTEMMSQLRSSLINPLDPNPSVEAILHALIPFKFVDHTHADAVVTISNSPKGKENIEHLFGNEVLVLPYVMPGFILAKQIATETRDIDWAKIKGIVLLNHGVFTFADDAKTSYDNMIDLVDSAEKFLIGQTEINTIARANTDIKQNDYSRLAEIRKIAGGLFGGAVVTRLDSSEKAVGFSELELCGDLISRGPLTPDHSIHTKVFGAMLDSTPNFGLHSFSEKYQNYFLQHKTEGLQMLDTMPRFGAWRGKGIVYFADNVKRLEIVSDIVGHTINAIQIGEALGGWRALPMDKLFEVEYWELEQAKLTSQRRRPPFEGKVTLVTGAASGIGAACVREMSDRGSAVIALDIDPMLHEMFNDPKILTNQCDVTDEKEIKASLEQGVQYFGGLDILISNAGIFSTSQNVESISDENWTSSLNVNLTSHMKVVRACVPYLKLGFDPSVVIMASKNVPAPGPGAAAYSVAKAGLTQFARIASMELGEYGIRINILHPNAVFDTGIWDDETLKTRASMYGKTVEEYKKSNILKQEVSSRDVARAAAVFAGVDLQMTTGSQIPVDGGNERVI